MKTHWTFLFLVSMLASSVLWSTFLCEIFRINIARSCKYPGIYLTTLLCLWKPHNQMPVPFTVSCHFLNRIDFFSAHCFWATVVYNSLSNSKKLCFTESQHCGKCPQPAAAERQTVSNTEMITSHPLPLSITFISFAHLWDCRRAGPRGLALHCISPSLGRRDSGKNKTPNLGGFL